MKLKHQFTFDRDITIKLIKTVCVLFPGVGIGMVMVSGIVCIYYNVIVAWTLYFLFMSFRAVLPWSTCDNDWNTPNCVDDFAKQGLLNSTDYNSTLSSMNGTIANMSVAAIRTAFAIAKNISDEHKVSASEEYWE